MLESQIQKRVAKRLRDKGWIVVKIIQCTQNGWPDLQAHKNGSTVFLEIKRPGEQPTRLQVYVHNLLRSAGFKVLIITNEKELESLL